VSDLPIWVEVHIDRTVLLATVVISILTCGLFGILPALRASALNPASVLKDESGGLGGGRRQVWLSSALAVAQISLSLFLLVAAGLFIRSFRAEQRYDAGFNSHNVLLESYDLFPAGYGEPAGIAFDQQVLDKIRTLPGVRAASIANWTPLGFSGMTDDFGPEGYVAGLHEAVSAGICAVSPGYFSVMEIPILEGRDFTSADSAKLRKGVIINRALAERYWHHQDALGKRM
jgi:MacB-like periplasmic core domain